MFKIIFLSLFLTLKDIAAPLSDRPAEKQLFSDVGYIAGTFKVVGEGRQMIACASTEPGYVLKFFKTDSMQEPWYLKWSLLNCLFKEKKERIRRRKLFFSQGYLLAQTYLPEETGIVFVHQAKNSQPMPTISIDNGLFLFDVDLNQIPFVVQKKGEVKFLDALEQAIGTEKLEDLIDQFIAFHRKRISYLIRDFDRNIEENYRILDGKLLYIDPGSFYYDPTLMDEQRQKEEWRRATHRLVKWLKNKGLMNEANRI